MDEAAAEEAFEAGAEEGAAPEGDAGDAGDPGPVSGAEHDALSPEQLDEMFGEDTEPEAIQSLTGSSGGDDETDDLAALENIPDPEPIPQGFSSDDNDALDDGLREKSPLKTIAIAAVVVVLALGAGVFFGRGFIIDMWPGAEKFYEMVGIGDEELGAGLVIKDVKSSRQVDNGTDVLMVRGVIANTSEGEKMVPMIKVALFDSTGQEVQHVIAPPLKNRLQGGTNIGFSAKLSEPSALARKIEVTFSKPEKAPTK